jgi:putative DNA primase/helicase
MIFNANELPRDEEQTNAFFRRFIIVPFDVTIPAEEQDRKLHRKIIDGELAGAFN